MEMTRTITLIIGIAVIASTSVVPAAFGAGRYGGNQEPVDFWNYESGVKVADSTPGVPPGDLAQLFSGTGIAADTTAGAPDLTQLLVAKNGVLDSSLTGAMAASSSSTTESPTGSGTDIAWDQIGIGLGIGVILAIGLGVALRFAHVRPFAH